eukprot:94521_1
MMSQWLTVAILMIVMIKNAISVSPYIPGFHFTPTPENWMNDPNGPFYDESTDLYHLMFQYKTPRLWGHAVSKDLFTWTNLPIALENDQPYDSGGVFSGSMTVVPSQTGPSKLYITYSVAANNAICIATPTNRSDPNLIKWTNYAGNPVVNKSQTNQTRFRDPSSAWTTDNGNTWYFIYGGVVGSTGKGGAGQIVKTTDWKTFEMKDNNFLYETDTNGAWSCPDFFKFPNNSNNDVTHLLMAIDGGDHWSIGTYDDINIRFIPYNNSDMTSHNQLFDYGGHFSASKSFYDGRNNRQVRFGWVHEERPVDSHGNPYGWAGVQSLPRVNKLYENNPNRIVTPIIDEFDNLHIEETHYMQDNIYIKQGDVMFFSQQNVSGNQLDIMMMNIVGKSNNSVCGAYILSDGPTEKEYTLVGVNFGKNEYFVDTKQSSLNPNVSKSISMANVFDWNGNKLEPLSLRIIIDHSIIEVYANDGLSCMTRRAYPTMTESVHVALYANGGDCTIQKFNAWNVYTTMWQ